MQLGIGDPPVQTVRVRTGKSVGIDLFLAPAGVFHFRPGEGGRAEDILEMSFALICAAIRTGIPGFGFGETRFLGFFGPYPLKTLSARNLSEIGAKNSDTEPEFGNGNFEEEHVDGVKRRVWTPGGEENMKMNSEKRRSQETARAVSVGERK